MARKKKSSDTKTLTLWGIRYTFDPKSQKWMEGKKEASTLVSAMLEELYEKFEKNKASSQDREETEIILSPLPEEKQEEITEELKEDAKLQRTESEQKVKTSPEPEKLEILKPNIEVESLVNPPEAAPKDKTERRLPKLESAIQSESSRQKIKDYNLIPAEGSLARRTNEDFPIVNLFTDALKKMQETGTASAGSEMLRDAITNLNKTLGSFAIAQKIPEQKTVKDDVVQKISEKTVGSEKSTDYLKSIDDRIAEILSVLRTEEKEEDTEELNAKAAESKRKLEESYDATGAELSKSVNEAVLGSEDARTRKGLLDSRLGKQIDANFARRLDEDLPILNLFTDKLQEMKQDPESRIGGVAILGDSFKNISRSIKGGAKSIFNAGKSGIQGLGKLAVGAGTLLAGGAGSIGKLASGAGSIGSGLLKKGGGLIRGAGSLIGSAAKNVGSFGKTVGLGAVSLASGAMSNIGTSAKSAGSLAKGFGKSFVKKIPILGALAGLGFGASRALSGDFTGAAMEVGSGLAGTIPGVGTAASLGLDAALAARDMGTFDGENLEKSEDTEMSVAEQQKPKISNQTSALKEFESQRRMVQDKRMATNNTGSSTTIINNNKSDKSGSRGGTNGIMPTAGSTRSLYLNYYAA